MVTELLEKRAPGVSGPRPPRGGDEGRDGGDGRKESGSPAPGILGDPARFGLLVFLGTVTMLFIGFTSAYILRRTAADWRPLIAPPVLWANTVALVLSSVLLERARRRLRGWDLRGAPAAVLAPGILGALFFLGPGGGGGAPGGRRPRSSPPGSSERSSSWARSWAGGSSPPAASSSPRTPTAPSSTS